MFNLFKSETPEEEEYTTYDIVPIVGINKDKMMRVVKKSGVPDELNSLFEKAIDTNDDCIEVNLTESQRQKLVESKMWDLVPSW